MLKSNRRSFLTSLIASPIALFAGRMVKRPEKALPCEPDSFLKYVSACLNATQSYPTGGIIYGISPIAHVAETIISAEQRMLFANKFYVNDKEVL
jgi:hypothetical protein